MCVCVDETLSYLLGSMVEFGFLRHEAASHAVGAPDNTHVQGRGCGGGGKQGLRRGIRRNNRKVVAASPELRRCVKVEVAVLGSRP